MPACLKLCYVPCSCKIRQLVPVKLCYLQCMHAGMKEQMLESKTVSEASDTINPRVSMECRRPQQCLRSPHAQHMDSQGFATGAPVMLRASSRADSLLYTCRSRPMCSVQICSIFCTSPSSTPLLWEKSKRSLSGSTMEPRWSMWSPSTCNWLAALRQPPCRIALIYRKSAPELQAHRQPTCVSGMSETFSGMLGSWHGAHGRGRHLAQGKGRA